MVDELEREASVAPFSLTRLSEIVNVMGGINVLEVLCKGLGDGSSLWALQRMDCSDLTWMEISFTRNKLN